MSDSRDRRFSRRAAPPLLFALAVVLLVLFCHDWGYSSLPPTEKRYIAAKARIATLKDDPKKNAQREPWEKLATEFRSIYDADPNWPNRPAALYRAAESLEELARHSCSRADARKAIAAYETVALRHASSRLADDALLKAARIRAASLRDDNGALALLERIKRQYPKGDMLPEAMALEKAIKASVKGKAAPDALRQVMTKDAQEDAPAQTLIAGKRKNFAGDLPLRYHAAVSRIENLKKDSLRSCWRQPWADLIEEFSDMAKTGKSKLAPNALYHAALCQENMAACSHLAADSKKAVQMYQDMAKRFPKSAFADDALLHAAMLQRNIKNSRDQASATLASLLKKYPKSDKAPEAKKLQALWRGEDAPSTLQKPAPKQPAVKESPELQVLSWDSPSKNSVEIVLEMSAPVKYRAHMTKAANGLPARVFVDLENASVVNDVRKGVSVQGSLLQAIRVKKLESGGSTLQFDFRDVSKFNARTDLDPNRIILSVVAGKAKLPGEKAKSGMVANAPTKKNNNIKARQVSNMASQLGLTVHKVFIDAGHGGKDPGTSHNNVVERAIALDVALRLGRLLKANGFEVAYSREKDKSVQLSQRTRQANAARADLFVSIHVNAHDNKSINGFETYFLNLATSKQAARVAMLENAGSDKRLADMQGMLAEVMLNARVDESHRLANDVQKSALFRLKKKEYSTRDNGVKAAPFHVLLGAQMPAILVELGYCTNAAEAKNLNSPQYRHALAEGLAEGVMAYRDRLLRNRTAGTSLTDNPSDAM